MFNVAVKWRKIGKNPVDTVKPINIKKTDQNRVRFFSPDELQLIFKNAEQPYKDVFKTLLYTGMRRNELRFLTVENIDFDKNLIYITHTADFKPKSESRSIPIHSAIRYMLKRRCRERGEGTVFINSDGKRTGPHLWWRHFKSLIEDLGLEAASLHTFRHTYISHLIMRGADLRTVQNLVGHEDIKTTLKYGP